MKVFQKFIFIVLSLVLLISLFSISVFADEIDDNINGINLLDYCYPNNGTSNFISIKDGQLVTFTFPDIMAVGYIDIVVQLTGPAIPPKSCTAYLTFGQSFNLTLSSIGNYCYRIYGYCGMNSAKDIKLEFKLTSTSSVAYLSFISFQLYNTRILRTDISANFYGSTTLGDFSILKSSGVPSDSYTITLPSGTNANSTYLHSYIDFDDWRKYDYIDSLVLLDIKTLTSVTAFMGETKVPISYDFVEDDVNLTYKLLNIRIDLRGLDRTSSDKPCIAIFGNLQASFVSQLSILSASGGIIQDTPEPEVFWLSKIFSKITSSFNDLSTWLSTGFQSIVNAIRGDSDEISSAETFIDDIDDQKNQLDDISNTMQSVTKPPVDDIDISLDGITDSDSIIQSTSFFVVILNNSIILQVMLISFTLALVAYVLYGKK